MRYSFNVFTVTEFQKRTAKVIHFSTIPRERIGGL
jgi:hypothetical protein